MKLTRSEWARLIDAVDGVATLSEVSKGLADARDIDDTRAYAIVEDALEEGILDERDTGGMFPEVSVVEDGASTDENPTLEADETGSSTPEPDGTGDKALEAFADAVEFFNQQLDADLSDLDALEYDTPRAYYRDKRGWDDDTIDAKCLGWAPADDHALLDHLMRNGYGREAILGTGMFDESLRPKWKGRYVLPYFDAEGRPTFAISRASDHPADWMNHKYDKPKVSEDYVRIEEPIYGVDSVEPGRPVLITEGIADAITAHQAGYPCLSPVTTSFKRDDRERLADVLEERDVDRVYVVNDAEPPSASLRDAEGWDRLHLEQYGEGVRGAVRTAGHLAEDGIDARIGELPQPAAEKVDLDDYLIRWDGDLRPVLATATPPADHPAYDPKSIALEQAKASRSKPDFDDEDGSDNRSRLYDLDIRDVTGLDWGYRGTNPLGHHGDSENYFVLEDGLAYDHKYKKAYNALTYLLCDAGERDAGRPNGSLDDAEHFEAWKHAKEEGLIPEDDPIPRRALQHIARDVTEWNGDLVEYETTDGESFEALPTDAYNAALAAAETEYGIDPGRDPITRPGGGWDADVDPTELDVILDPDVAYSAAGGVTADHYVGEDLERLDGLSPTEDGERWRVDGREGAGAFDIVRAVGIAEGIVEPEEPMNAEQYTRAYDRARDAYDAPLPEYVDATTATDRWHVIQGAVSQLTHWHLSSIRSDVTGVGDDEDVLAVIDPCWTDSASGERIVAFRSGAFYNRETEQTIDPLRFVALETGLIDDPTNTLAGDDFKQAYHRAREEYGAPLPEWNVGNPSHIAVLPPAEDLLGEFTTDAGRLERARDRVEELYREIAGDSTKAHLLTALPALGKTTSVVKNADEYPALYLAPRRELMEEVAAKANKYGRSWMYLPTFAEGGPTDEAILEATAYVREHGKDALRDREDLPDAVDAPIFDEDDEDATDLERDSCPTASGEYGEGWALAVHVAHELGHTPQEIHNRDLELFGERLPCHAEEGEECPYSVAWDRATDPENPKDILIGHYVHAHVAGARTYYYKRDDRTQLKPRTLAVDEYPGDAYAETFGESARDYATWLAGALRGIDDHTDLLENARDLWSDDWVRAWCHGDVAAVNKSTSDLLDALDAAHAVSKALGEVRDVRTTYAETIAEHGLESALETVPEPGGWTPESGRGALEELRDALDGVSKGEGGGVRRLSDDTLEAIGEASAALKDTDAVGSGETLLETLEVLIDAVPVATGGELWTLLKDAVDAYREGERPKRIESTKTALEGGSDGCRELALASNDGYAHPEAYLLLYATIARDDGRADVGTIGTPSFSFDGTDGTTLKRVKVGSDTVLLDRNQHGAITHTPPELRDRAGGRNSFVGLDATGRPELWRLAIGRDLEQIDPHETAAERRRFLREVLNLQVIQTSTNINTYSGDPKGKNFDEDLTLAENVAGEYGSKQLRRDTLTSTTNPGIITTKKVRNAIGDDLEGCAEAVDHYGNVTGSNALGELNLGIVLGTRHFGDCVVEKWAALAGEEVSRSGHGATLDYGSDVANTYLEHMREDETMQAILRFGRDEEGAVVFAHTAALREDLPVVGDGTVVRAFSPTTRAVAETLPQFKRGRFTVSDVADHVDRSKRSIQRALAELAELGYLERDDPGEGLANQYDTLEQPGRGEVSLPELEGEDPPDKPRMDIQYTVTVGVRDDSQPEIGPTPATRAIIPSPDGSNKGDRASPGAD